ncbi:MAG: hypothetical protein GXC70_04925 [Sphingomonadaceae bacterium]|nr:hypothetical protein [Sphingomonadaceae bacterium]
MTPVESFALMLALAGALLAALPSGGWNERICAGAVLLPVLTVLARIAATHGMVKFDPSVLLRAGLELACLFALLHVAFSADRRFPLVMAAAALIGVMARGVQLAGLGGPHLPLLLMPALPLLIMALALIGGICCGSLRQRRSEAG